MSDIKLPELPASQMNVEVWDSQARGLHQANQPYYTVDQLREYAKQAAEMEWAEWYRRGLEQGLLSGKEREQQRLYRLVADDAWAITFQTFGQYRTALLKAIRGTK